MITLCTAFNSASTLRCLCITLLLMLTLGVTPSFAQKEMSAFSYVDKVSTSNTNGQHASAAQADSASAQLQGVDTWKIALNEQLLSMEQGDSLQIPLPSGQVLNATIKTRKEFKNGDVQFSASMGRDGSVILTVGSNVVYGNVIRASEQVNFSISIDGEANQILLNNDTLPEGAVDLTDDMVELDLPDNVSQQSVGTTPIISEATVSFSTSRASETDGKTNIDMLFVYSSEFDELFGSAETRINQLIGFTNRAYDDTGILINLRVAAAIELDIDDSDAANILLNDARADRANTGFDNLSELRNQTGADLVAILTTSANRFGANGIANVGGSNQNAAFSSTKLSLNCCDVVFAHEIGHNLGSGHQRAELLLPANSGISACTGGSSGFSCGHSVNENGSTNWSTIMASGRNINRRNIFSNLTLDCDGDPCGIAQGQAGAADNLTSFNFTRIAISQFRDEVIPEPEPDDNFLLELIPSIIRSTK